MSLLGRIYWGAVFLAGSPRRLARSPRQAFRRLAWPMMLGGIAWGLVTILLWDVTFRLTWPRTLNWVLPACLCAAGTMLGPYRQAALALAQALTGRRRLLRWTGLLALTAGLAAILNAAVSSSPYWPVQLAGRWAWLSPGALYRLLLLAPVWGAWSMLALGQFHRPGQDCDAPAREFSGSVGPVTVAVALLLPLTGSLVMLNFLYPAHFVPPAAALAAALGGGTGIIRLTGGPDRRALLATNLLTQFGFLLAYLAVK